MKYVTSHLMGVRLQNYKLLNLPYTNVPNTTLNELFDVQSGVPVDTGQTPNLAFLAIGNGGHVMGTTADGTSYPKLVNHSPRDCALINHLPFRMVLASADLSAADRANYAMRVPKTVNGVNYIAYYLKKFDLSTVTVTMLDNTVTNGQVSSVPWVPTNSNLHPTPSIPSDTGAVQTTGDYVSVQAVLQAIFTTDDIGYLMDVANILYGTTDLAIVSEAALVAAQIKQVSASISGGGTLTYNEAIGAILCSSESAYYHLPSLNQQLGLTFEVGGAESLYGVNDGTVTVV